MSNLKRSVLVALQQNGDWMLLEEVACAIRAKPSSIFKARVRANLERLKSERQALHRLHPQTQQAQYKFNHFRPERRGGDKIRNPDWRPRSAMAAVRA